VEHVAFGDTDLNEAPSIGRVKLSIPMAELAESGYESRRLRGRWRSVDHTRENPADKGAQVLLEET